MVKSFIKLVMATANESPDYTVLSKMSNLSAADRKIVQQQLVKIPPRRKAAQEEEMGEMMGKLKGVSIINYFKFQNANYNSIVGQQHFETFRAVDRQLQYG